MYRKASCFIWAMLLLVAMTSCGETKDSGLLSVFQQEISTSSSLQALKANEKVTLDINVKNTGNEAWPNKGSDEKDTNVVALGFYWQNSAGKKIEDRQGFASLPDVLKPGSSVSLKAIVQAPSEPGNYKLFFTMFQNKVAWFNNQGATPLIMNVKVEK